MRNRVVLWATAGFVVAAFSALYFYPTSPNPAAPIWTLVRVTCPIAFASLYFHFPVGIYTSLLANAATYALVALVAETLWRQLSYARWRKRLRVNNPRLSRPHPIQ